MKKILKANAMNAAAFSVVFYVFSMFLTLDVYCKNQVTPETPLYNIAGLPFLRMEFVLIVFALAFAAGILLAALLKTFGRTLLPFSLGCLGLISVFMFVFDVNTMQIFSPTMRISHVIMTVSRVLAIMAGASGIFTGVCAAFLSSSVISKKPAAAAGLCALLCSVFTNAENLQTLLYLLCAALLLAGALLADFFPSEKALRPVLLKKGSAASSAFEFLSVLSLTALYAVSESVILNNAGAGYTALTVIQGMLLLLIVWLSDYKRSCLPGVFAVLLGGVTGYILVHYASEVITYSSNRVVYVVAYFIPVILLILSAVFALLSKRGSSETA